MYYWIASLSNGERLSSNELTDGDGKNPWDKVVDYTKNKDLDITHVELIVNGQRYNSPSNSRKAIFQSSNIFDKFWIFYRSSAIIGGKGGGDHYMGYSYRIGDFRHIFWVNTANNTCYNQALNIVNPTNKEEKSFQVNENIIESIYRKTNKGQ